MLKVNIELPDATIHRQVSEQNTEYLKSEVLLASNHVAEAIKEITEMYSRRDLGPEDKELCMNTIMFEKGRWADWTSIAQNELFMRDKWVC